MPPNQEWSSALNLGVRPPRIQSYALKRGAVGHGLERRPKTASCTPKRVRFAPKWGVVPPKQESPSWALCPQTGSCTSRWCPILGVMPQSHVLCTKTGCYNPQPRVMPPKPRCTPPSQQCPKPHTSCPRNQQFDPKSTTAVTAPPVPGPPGLGAPPRPATCRLDQSKNRSAAPPGAANQRVVVRWIRAHGPDERGGLVPIGLAPGANRERRTAVIDAAAG